MFAIFGLLLCYGFAMFPYGFAMVSYGFSMFTYHSMVLPFSWFRYVFLWFCHAYLWFYRFPTVLLCFRMILNIFLTTPSKKNLDLFRVWGFCLGRFGEVFGSCLGDLGDIFPGCFGFFFGKLLKVFGREKLIRKPLNK